MKCATCKPTHWMFLSVLVIVLVALFVLSGCGYGHMKHSHGHGIRASVVNTHCPMMGTKLGAKPKMMREFHGKKIGFCCKSCVTKWDQLSASERESKLKASCAKFSAESQKCTAGKGKRCKTSNCAKCAAHKAAKCSSTDSKKCVSASSMDCASK